MFVVNWIKQNKLATLLFIVVLFLLLKPVIIRPLQTLQSVGFGNRLGGGIEPTFEGKGGDMALGAPSAMIAPDIYPQPDYVPQPGVRDRLVVENSYMSLLVENVVTVKDKIIEYAKNNGGYMVQVSVSNPQDAPNATVTVRVSSDRLNEALSFFRGLAVKVVSEELDGQDVTDQYTDIEKRIAILEKTKARFEEILASAQEISDITNLNQQIINLQSQIDSYRGQEEALKQNANLAKLTLYLSTDEIALPYAPSETFRPGVIFKLAVRSLISQLRQAATVAIWVGVYAVIWVPALLIVFWLYKKVSARTCLPAGKA